MGEGKIFGKAFPAKSDPYASKKELQT